MDEVSKLEPGDHPLSPEEVGSVLQAAIRASDQGARTLQSLDPKQAEELRLTASRYREIRWLISEGDEVYLRVEPPGHPELLQGSVYLVVMRDGQVVLKQLVGLA